MYYPNSARTAIEVVSELLDETQSPAVVEACRTVLQVASETETLLGTPNRSIVTLCSEKDLGDQASSAALLFRRAARHAEAEGLTFDANRFNCCEGLMWGAAAVLFAEYISSMLDHPSCRG
jgi:hypothetical protein